MKSEKNSASPLSAATLHILLALAGEDLHGYGIILEVARLSQGAYKLGPGTLYDNLKKLLDAGLVADATRDPAAPEDGEDARRFYTLTTAGRSALAAEIERMRRVVREVTLRLEETRPKRV